MTMKTIATKIALNHRRKRLAILYYKRKHFCVYVLILSVCVPGVWGERWRPGEIWARHQIPAAAVQTGICYPRNWWGKPVPLTLVSQFMELMFVANINTLLVNFLQVSKTLKTTHSNLLESVCDDDCNPAPDASSTPSVEGTADGTGAKPSLAKRRANQQDTETFYFTVRNRSTVHHI